MLRGEKMIFCSWSGGKDSCLALYYALKQFGKVDLLFTMLGEDCERSRAHGLRKELLLRQSKCLGISHEFGCASWGDYEQEFLSFLFRKMRGGIGIFGDIDLEEHKAWVEKVCSKANVKAIEPLWKKDREEILGEFLDLGFKAVVVATSKKFPKAEKLLGKQLSKQLIEVMNELNIDKCGENGEYHTFVYDGPIFEKPVQFSIARVIENDHSFNLELI